MSQRKPRRRPGPPAIVKVREENEAMRNQLIGLSVITRALVATLLDASGKGDETAVIFTPAEMAAANDLQLDYAPMEDGSLALVMSGLTEQKARAAEALEAKEEPNAGVDTFAVEDETSTQPAPFTENLGRPHEEDVAEGILTPEEAGWEIEPGTPYDPGSELD